MSERRPPELQTIFDEIERGGPYASVADLNRTLGARTSAYNARPQAALGGLSPDEMAQLLYGDWKSQGAVRLNENITSDELAGVAILADARTLLEHIANEGPLRETAARNLPRAVVASLLPRLRMAAQRRIAEEIDTPSMANEGDVHWLFILRHTLMFAGLIARRKGLRVRPRGRELLRIDRAGELYALLFRTLFQVIDLRVLDRDDRHRGLQATVAYSFYKLRSSARDWASAEALAKVAWLESSKDSMTQWEAANNFDLRWYAFGRRVLEPLVQFGLLEERLVKAEQRWKDYPEYRMAPLFDRFLRFEFRREGAVPPFMMP